jgi:hypothetical protein
METWLSTKLCSKNLRSKRATARFGSEANVFGESAKFTTCPVANSPNAIMGDTHNPALNPTGLTAIGLASR